MQTKKNSFGGKRKVHVGFRFPFFFFFSSSLGVAAAWTFFTFFWVVVRRDFTSDALDLHTIKEAKQHNELHPMHIKGTENIADVFTKANAPNFSHVISFITGNKLSAFKTREHHFNLIKEGAHIFSQKRQREEKATREHETRDSSQKRYKI